MNTIKSDMNETGRLQKRSDFLRVQAAQNKWVSKTVILQSAPNTLSKNRFGVTVTKKIAKKAVDRNRMKRRLRAAAFEILPTVPESHFDYVLIGRAETLHADYQTLKKDLRWCLKRLKEKMAEEECVE